MGDADCNVSGIGLIASSSSPNAWQRLTVAGTAPNVRDGTAVVILENSASCQDSVYFDDVLLVHDTVFGNGFEAPFAGIAP